MENNIKPTLIKSFYSITQQLKNIGFSERDITILLQDRTKPKLPLSQIKIMLLAITQFEKDFIKFKKLTGETNEME